MGRVRTGAGGNIPVGAAFHLREKLAGPVYELVFELSPESWARALRSHYVRNAGSGRRQLGCAWPCLTHDRGESQGWSLPRSQGASGPWGANSPALATLAGQIKESGVPCQGPSRVTAGHTSRLSVAGLSHPAGMFPPRDTFTRTMRPLCTVGDLSVPAGGLAFITIVTVVTTASSAKGLVAHQHAEPGSSPLAEPPSAAAAAPSAPLPSNPSGSHGLLASTAWRGTGAKRCCRGWVGRAGQDPPPGGAGSSPAPWQLPTGWAVGKDTGPPALPGHAEELTLTQCGLVAAVVGKGVGGLAARQTAAGSPIRTPTGAGWERSSS